jgi:hypothetical protein
MSGVVTRDPFAASSAETTPESQLRPITIKQLEPFLGGPAKGQSFHSMLCVVVTVVSNLDRPKPFNTQTGRILRVKTITPPCQSTAVQVVVEDEEGTAINFSMYNVTSGSGKLKLKCVLCM